jgi:riboflavin biosynthesis pyrimidine reductase
MLLRQVIPPGPEGSPQSFYTDLRLADVAPAHRPYVICNFVSSADGKASFQGRTAPLGGDGDRAVFHLLRTQADAVLAGTRTLEVERYGAMIRDPEMIVIRRDEGRCAQPLAVVISRSGRVPFDIPLFADPGSRVALYVPDGTEPPPCAAELIVHLMTGSEFSLGAVLNSLREEHGVGSLLCEGGPTLLGAMLSEGLVDELFLTLAPALVGGGEEPLSAGPPLAELIPLNLKRVLERDGHLFLRYGRR